MLSAEDIQYYLSVFKELSITDLIGLFNMAGTKRLPAHSVYIKEGALHRKLAFIKKGLIRAYLLKENGEEITVLLRWENQFIASHDNIILQQPSRFIYEAMEDTVILEIDYDKAQELLDRNPKLAAQRNSFILNMLADSMTRVESFILLTPEERYLQLVKEKANIVNRVPDKHLATLLGITPVSLSRIRKRIAAGGRH
ncbi:Crp/Fnr family transcriptional regulator [Mucilaginibacter koreensis]